MFSLRFRPLAGAFTAGMLACLVAAASPLAHAAAAPLPTPLDAQSFTDHVAQRLRQQLGDAEAVTVKAPLSLDARAVPIPLGRIFHYCQAKLEACPDELDRFIQAAVQQAQGAGAPIDLRQLRVVLRNGDYVKRTQGGFQSSDTTLLARPFGDELLAVAVLDTPNAVKPLHAADLQRLGLTPDQLFTVASENTGRGLPPLPTKSLKAGETGRLGGNFYEVSRVTRHGDWEALAQAQKGRLLVSMPSTDLLLYSAARTPQAIDAFRQQTRSAAQESPSPLSLSVLRWTPEGWKAVP